MKSLLFFFIVLSITCFAQLDTLDRVELKDSKVFTGKVIKVTSGTVQFRESLTNLLHEFNKGEIKDIKLSNGVTVTFDEKNPASGTTQNLSGSQKTDTQTQNQVVGSSRNQTENKGQTDASGQKTQTNTTTPAPADDSSSKMDTSMIIVLAAGGLVALLLLGALIF
ncbi:MAG: hypothetical protein HF314_10375 [Ignavibacteria bacterium]|jgi:sensor c-di-GMP phosphodiesterase-like protein|nr:hypothetical protein [Ignavibacteria bacterium]MCU7503471.1 hypothetical protein [Ignavibacteria bacterium]MCU7516197.1 hypothetical protein [Ignavibacteria bacterium]